MATINTASVHSTDFLKRTLTQMKKDIDKSIETQRGELMEAMDDRLLLLLTIPALQELDRINREIDQTHEEFKVAQMRYEELVRQSCDPRSSIVSAILDGFLSFIVSFSTFMIAMAFNFEMWILFVALGIALAGTLISLAYHKWRTGVKTDKAMDEFCEVNSRLSKLHSEKNNLSSNYNSAVSELGLRMTCHGKLPDTKTVINIATKIALGYATDIPGAIIVINSEIHKDSSYKGGTEND